MPFLLQKFFCFYGEFRPETDFHIFVRGWGMGRGGGVLIDIWGGAAACFARGLVAASRKAKENV